MERFVYINGVLVKERDARVSVFDRGLCYGDGLFETLKTCDGRPVFLKEHMERLAGGLLFMKIQGRPLMGFWADLKGGLIGEILEKNRLNKGTAYIKIIVTRGVDTTGHAPPLDLKPNIIIISKPLDIKAISAYQEKGVKAALIKGCRPAIPGYKTLNYLPNIIAKAEARWRGVFEGIFATPTGEVLEGTSTNIFAVKKGVIRTPPLKAGIFSGVLPGVTRRAVMDVSRRDGFSVREAKIREEDLYASDEAFLTNSIIEVVPLVSVDGKRIGGGRPGPITKKIQLAYKRAAREDLSAAP